MYPEKGDTVANTYDDDLGTVLQVGRDDAQVSWEDGTVTWETFGTFGVDGGTWWKVEA